MPWLVRKAMSQLYPRTEELPGAEDCDLEGFLRKFKRETTPLMWAGVTAGALAYHASPALTVKVPLPAFLLPRGLADKHAHRVATTDFYLLRQAILLVKLPAGMLWGGHPEVRRKLGLEPLAADPGTWRTT